VSNFVLGVAVTQENGGGAANIFCFSKVNNSKELITLLIMIPYQ
jgi:hypothetical protein